MISTSMSPAQRAEPFHHGDAEAERKNNWDEFLFAERPRGNAFSAEEIKQTKAFCFLRVSVVKTRSRDGPGGQRCRERHNFPRTLGQRLGQRMLRAVDHFRSEEHTSEL